MKRYRSMSVRCSRMRLRSRPRNRSVRKHGERGGKIADVPVYFTDAIVRRSAPLQATHDAVAQGARERAYVEVVRRYKRRQGAREAGRCIGTCWKSRSMRPLPTAVHVSAAHESTATLGAMFGPITLERMMDAITAGSQTLGSAWPIVWSLAKIPRSCCQYLDSSPI